MIFTENMEETCSAYTWANFSTFLFIWFFMVLGCHHRNKGSNFSFSCGVLFLLCLYIFHIIMCAFSQETPVSFHNTKTSMLVWTCQTELHCECRHVCLLCLCVGALMDWVANVGNYFETQNYEHNLRKWPFFFCSFTEYWVFATTWPVSFTAAFCMDRF